MEQPPLSPEPGASCVIDLIIQVAWDRCYQAYGHRPARTGFNEPRRGPVDNRRTVDGSSALRESHTRPASRAVDRHGEKPWTALP